MNESEINLDYNSKDLVHVYLESVLSVVTFVLVQSCRLVKVGIVIFHLFDPVKVVTGILQLAVQDGEHFVGYVGVLHCVPLEDGARPPVRLRDEEVEVLTGADQARVLVVRVQHYKAGGADQVCEKDRCLEREMLVCPHLVETSPPC